MDFEVYAQRRAILDMAVPPWLLHLIQQSPPRRLADFGCGDGALLLALRDQGLISEQQEVWALDGSETRLNRLQQNWSGIKLRQADVTNSGLETGSLDLAISTQVIEHVPNQSAMIEELARVLKPTGSLYLTTVFKNWYGWYFHRSPCGWALDPTHLREYRHDSELFDDLERSGLTVLKQRKNLLFYPVLDPILKFGGQWRLPKLLRWMRKIQVPIMGYYNWEVVARRGRSLKKD